MTNKFSNIIPRLKQATYIKSNKSIEKFLIDIDKYAATDEEKAFMLGQLFRNYDLSHHLPEEVEKFVKYNIRKEHLNDLFYDRITIKIQKLTYMPLFLLGIGSLFIFVGSISLYNGYFSIGISSRYMTTIVNEGGKELIFGVCLFIGGYMSYQYEKGKEILITNLDSLATKSS